MAIERNSEYIDRHRIEAEIYKYVYESNLHPFLDLKVLGTVRRSLTESTAESG